MDGAITKVIGWFGAIDFNYHDYQAIQGQVKVFRVERLAMKFFLDTFDCDSESVFASGIANYQ
jgi:hypothetical protein